MAVLFMGGYHGPFAAQLPLLGLVYLLLKGSIWYFISLLMRNALPRVRIDQLMLFNWLFLVPISIVNVLVTSFLLMVIRELGLTPNDPRNFIDNIPQTLILFAGNVALGLVVLTMIRNYFRRERLNEQKRLLDRADVSDILPATTGD